MSGEHVLDGTEDLAFAFARGGGADALEKGLGLADGAAGAFGGGGTAEKRVNRRAEGVGEGG